mgnify:FL=1
MEILHHLFRNSNVSQQVNVYALCKCLEMMQMERKMNKTEEVRVATMTLLRGRDLKFIWLPHTCEHVVTYYWINFRELFLELFSLPHYRVWDFVLQLQEITTLSSLCKQSKQSVVSWDISRKKKFIFESRDTLEIH